jgi:hypothetical protein
MTDEQKAKELAISQRKQIASVALGSLQEDFETVALKAMKYAREEERQPAQRSITEDVYDAIKNSSRPPYPSVSLVPQPAQSAEPQSKRICQFCGEEFSS